jgi:hypothetical protein
VEQALGEGDVAVLGPLPCWIRMVMRSASMSDTLRAIASLTRSPAA